MEDAYMAAALPALDASDAVYRYAWYSARNAPIVDVDDGCLLQWNISVPTPTSTGAIYKAHAARWAVSNE